MLVYFYKMIFDRNGAKKAVKATELLNLKACLPYCSPKADNASRRSNVSEALIFLPLIFCSILFLSKKTNLSCFLCKIYLDLKKERKYCLTKYDKYDTIYEGDVIVNETNNQCITIFHRAVYEKHAKLPDTHFHDRHAEYEKLCFKGLDKNASYRNIETGKEYFGSVLEHVGITMQNKGDFSSEMMIFEKKVYEPMTE